MDVLGLSDLEYSFSLVTNWSNSACVFSRFSRLLFCSSGLYRLNNSSSVGVTQIVNAGPPTQMAAPLLVYQYSSFSKLLFPII